MTESLLELNDLQLEFERRENPERPTLNSDTQPSSRPTEANYQSEPRPESQGQRQDLFDTFQLMKTYLDHKLVDLKSDILSDQASLSKKFRDEANIKFKSEGNRLQYRFNEEILDGIRKLQRFLPSSEQSATNIIFQLEGKLKERNKLIRIADNSAGGWTTVREYENTGYADNEEDEKKIRQAESRALRAIKDKRSRPTPYPQYPVKVPPSVPAATAPNPAYPAYNNFPRIQPPFRSSAGRREPSMWDVCYTCKLPGYWKTNCPLNNFKTTATTSSQQSNSSVKQ